MNCTDWILGLLEPHGVKDLKPGLPEVVASDDDY